MTHLNLMENQQNSNFIPNTNSGTEANNSNTASVIYFDKNHTCFINNLTQAYIHVKPILTKSNEAFDFEFIEINGIFEKLSKLNHSEIIGKTATHCIPELLHDKFDWLQMIAETAIDMQSKRKEIYSDLFDKWFDVSAFSIEKGSTILLFDDISRMKVHEIKAQWGEHKLLEKNQEIALQIESFKSQNEGFHDLNIELLENNTTLQQIINKLKESENKYQILFNSSSEGFFIMTDIVLDCNQQACEIFGFTKKELVGKHPSELSPAFQPDGRKSMESANEKIQAAMHGINQQFFWKHKRNDNTLIDTQITLKAIQLKNQKVLFATICDISQKIKNELKLKENEKKLNEVYQIAKIGSWQLDVENREITLSKEHQLLIGLDSLSSLPVSMSLFEYADKYIVPQDISLILKEFQKVETISDTNPSPKTFEYRVNHKSGEIRYLSVHAKIFEKGIIYGVAQDVTERKLAEQILTTTDIILKGVNHASGILLTEIDFYTAIKKSIHITGYTSKLSRISIYVNFSENILKPYFNQQFDWTENDFVLNNPLLQNLYYSEQRLDRWLEILKSGEIIKGSKKDFPFKEQMFLENMGILSLLIVPIFMENKLWGFISFEDNLKIRNWTTSEENILRNFSNSIGGVIFKQMRNDEIISAKEKAQESDRLKTAFLANMSHEIRTPMNAILGFTDLLKDESLSAHSRNEFIEIINSRGKDLLQIINDIIDISKIEAKQIKIHPVQCSVNSVLFELYSFFESNITLKLKKDIVLKLHTDLPNDKSYIYIDDIRLKQIFTNLIGNAIKFTELGYIEFGYSFENNILNFYVEDTGIGIPKEKHILIFDRFRQADDSTTKNFGGTGLGLAISKSLVELMGGIMKLDSELGSGSKFSFSLPYNPEEENKIKEKEKNKDFIDNINWQNKLILVVEDDHVNFQYLKVLLKKTQAKVIRAENGVEAIEMCKEHENINVVLMDIQMPIMNGFEATKIIKAMRKDLPIIAQTAYAMAEDKEKCRAAGCDDYLTKPIDIKSLICVTGKYLNN